MQLQIFDVEHGACSVLTADNNERLMIDFVVVTMPLVDGSPARICAKTESAHLRCWRDH